MATFIILNSDKPVFLGVRPFLLGMNDDIISRLDVNPPTFLYS
mgnify:CR=1 FL=1